VDSPPDPLRDEATACLASVAAGDRSARNRLFELVYAQLHDQASSYLKQERSDHTLQSTALVHEAWLRLIDQDRVEVHDRGHFLALAAMAMRRILVDHARGRGRRKRGAAWHRMELEEAAAAAEEETGEFDLLEVDRALDRLQEQSAQLAKIVELRFFGGLAREEIAEALGISRSTVARQWRAAKALMSRLLADPGGAG